MKQQTKLSQEQQQQVTETRRSNRPRENSRLRRSCCATTPRKRRAAGHRAAAPKVHRRPARAEAGLVETLVWRNQFMKKIFNNLFSSLPLGARLVLLAYALGFPLALAGALHAHLRTLCLARPVAGAGLEGPGLAGVQLWISGGRTGGLGGESVLAGHADIHSGPELDCASNFGLLPAGNFCRGAAGGFVETGDGSVLGRMARR